MKIRQIISIVSLVSCVVSVYLLLQKPRPVAEPQAPAAVAANAQSFQYKLGQLERARARGQAETEVRLNSDEVNAAIVEATGTSLASPHSQPRPAAATTSEQSQPTGSAASSGEQPTVKDYQVNFEGDVVKGQFLVPIAGKDVWVTVAGHLGAKDGYATFDPTQFKVGEMNIPVSLVNDALQKKLSEQRDQLKLPEFIGDVKVENGELVMKEK